MLAGKIPCCPIPMSFGVSIRVHCKITYFPKILNHEIFTLVEAATAKDFFMNIRQALH